MKTAVKSLPDDVDSLHEIIHLLSVENTQKNQTIQSQKNEITLLQEKLNLAIQKRFAAQSEKHSPDQLGLFDEAEQLDNADSDTEIETDDQRH